MASTSRRQRGLVILRTGWNCGSQYLFGQHTLLGRDIGITEAEIVALTRPLTTFPWAGDDRVLLQMADELYTDCSVTDPTWAELAARWPPREILEFVMTIGFYFMACGIHNASASSSTKASPAGRTYPLRSWPKKDLWT